MHTHTHTRTHNFLKPTSGQRQLVSQPEWNQINEHPPHRKDRGSTAKQAGGLYCCSFCVHQVAFKAETFSLSADLQFVLFAYDVRQVTHTHKHARILTFAEAVGCCRSTDSPPWRPTSFTTCTPGETADLLRLVMSSACSPVCVCVVSGRCGNSTPLKLATLCFNMQLGDLEDTSW